VAASRTETTYTMRIMFLICYSHAHTISSLLSRPFLFHNLERIKRSTSVEVSMLEAVNCFKRSPCSVTCIRRHILPHFRYGCLFFCHGNTYIHTYIHTYIYAYIYTYIYAYTYAYIYTYIRTYTHSHIYVHTCIHTYIYTHSHIHVHTYIHIYICTHIHTHTHAYTYVHIYIYIHT
jgi:hypothetical protein